MTLQTLQAKQDFVDRGDFDVGIQRVVVAGVSIRVHWTPYFVPMVAIVDQFRHLTGIKVLNARFETTKIGNRESPHEIRTLVRYITVEATTTSWVLHLIQWRHGGASGQALVTMAGRPGVCLRCLSPSHFRRDCRATFCGNCRKWGQHDARECTVRPTWASTTAPMRSAAEMDDLNEEDEDPEARVSLTSADAPSSTVSLGRRTSTDSSRPRKPPLLLSLTVRRRRPTGRRPMLLILTIF